MHTLIIGLDGLNWPLLEPLLAAGLLPTLARLRREGVAAPLLSVLPTQSASAWASFMTGQQPAVHGVFDFLARQPDGRYRHAKPAPGSTLWAWLNRGGLAVGAINFPVTYPPDPVQPFQVSGMLSLEQPPFTHPPALAAEIRQAVPDYRLDLEWQLYAGRPDALLAELTQMTQARVRLVERLTARHALDVLAVAYISPDRLLHALWWMLDPTHPAADAGLAAQLQPAWEAYWRTLDQAVARTIALAGADTTVFILSDHGFQAAVWQFRVNEWLAQHGWYRSQAGRGRLTGLLRRLDTPLVQHWRRRLIKDVSRFAGFMTPGGATDWAHTLAFCPWNTQQGIRLNLAGRDPAGVVTPGSAAERLLTEIEQALAAARFDGQPLVGGVVRLAEQMAGQTSLAQPDLLPDLLFWLNPPFAGNLQTPGLFTRTGWASGDHALTGMLLAWGAGIAAQAGAARPLSPTPRLIDIAPTVLHSLGLAVPETMQGRALTELLQSTAPVRRQAPAPAAESAGQAALNDAETADLQERLRGLGYL